MNKIEIQSGIGEFNLVGTKNCSIYEFRNRPQIMVWEMNWNTLMNFFIGKQAKQRVLFLEVFSKLEEALNNGKVNNLNCVELIEPLLNQFTNAVYEIEIEEIEDAYHIIYPGETTFQDKEKTKHIISTSNWAGGHPYIYSFQRINESLRVEFYKEQINKGIRPQILILQANNSEISFILDGHHKLDAYNETTINANVVRIKKMTNYEISDDEIMTTFDKLNNIENQKGVDSKTINQENNLKIKLATHLEDVRKPTNCDKSISS